MTERRILVVDDDENNRLLLRTVLESANYSVMEADNAEAALHAMRNFTPHLAIVDLRLRAESGTDFIMKARSEPELRDMIILLYTATSLTGAMRDFMQAHRVEGHIEKPAEPQAILAAVSEHFRP